MNYNTEAEKVENIFYENLIKNGFEYKKIGNDIIINKIPHANINIISNSTGVSIIWYIITNDPTSIVNKISSRIYFINVELYLYNSDYIINFMINEIIRMLFFDVASKLNTSSITEHDNIINNLEDYLRSLKLKEIESL